MENGKVKKLGKNFGLLSVGSFASKILTFLLVPLYTSILTTEEYGIVDIINTTVNLMFPIVILVISEAVVRFSLDLNIDKSQVFTIGIIVTSVGCLIALIASPLFLLSGLKQYYWFFIFQLFIMAFHSTISQFVKGLEEVKAYAIGGIINTAVVVGLNVLLLLQFRLGLTGYLISLLSGHLLTIIYYFIKVKLWRYMLPISKVDRKILKGMISYSAPMIPNSISWWISDSSDKYVVQMFCGLAVNGIYAVAYKIPSLLSMVSTLFIGAWQISACEDPDSEETRKFFSNVANEYVKINLLVSSFLIFATRPIAKIMFAAEFYEAWKYTPILILAYVFYTSSSFWGTVYTTAKKTKPLFYSTILAAGANIVLNFCFTPKFGAMGAAVATLISYGIVCLFRIIHSRTIIKLQIDWKTITLSFALVFAEVLIMAIEKWYSIVICGAIFVLLLIINRHIFMLMIKKILNKLTKNEPSNN